MRLHRPLILSGMVVSIVLLLPLLLYGQTEQGVFIERWDYDGDGFTGIVRNDTENGIHDIEISFTFRDTEGKVLSAEKVTGIVGYPAVIEGVSYYWSQQTLDYLPPRSVGYFSDYGPVPAGTDTSKTDIKPIWKWAENARISREVPLVEETLTLMARGYGPTLYFSGEVRNTTQSAITDVRVYVVPVHNDGHVVEIETESVVDKVIGVGETAAFSVGFYKLNERNVKLLAHAILWNYETNPPPGPPPPASTVSPTIVYVPLDTVKLTVHDTFTIRDTIRFTFRDTIDIRDTLEVTVRDTIEVKKPPELLGDLNEDGAVNFSDFIIFAQQFGKVLGMLYSASEVRF